MKTIVSLMLLMGALLFACPATHAADFDFFGTINYSNDVLQFNFTASGDSNVTLFSSSWDDGGFDPMLGLWNSLGTLIYFQDDGHNVGTTASNGVDYTHGYWDSYYTVPVGAGDYTITLSTFNNFNNGDNLSDGFNFDGATPIPIAQWDEPSNGYKNPDYAFHVLNVAAAEQVVTPEPASMALFGLGGSAMAFFRRKMKKDA